MTDNNVAENNCKYNGKFDRLCVNTLAGFDEKLSMATAIYSIGLRNTEANKFQ